MNKGMDLSQALTARRLALGLASAAWVLSAAPALAQTFTPNETQASPQRNLIDYESASRAAC